MDELELVGLHDDGEHIVLEGHDGARFKVRIDEPLRAAARRDRPRLELLRAEGGPVLPPREIQSRIRAGETADDVAAAGGLAVEIVRRYEGPVLAEREFIASQAQSSRLGRESDSPELGDLVLDRLAARGVDPGSMRWDAFRASGEPWTVVVRFDVGSDEREARWSFDHQSRTITALEDEARWLSETQLADEPIPRRHLAAVRDVVFDVEASETGHVLTPLEVQDAEDETPEPPEEATATLLAELSGKRGVRQEIELPEDDDDFEGFGPQHAFDFGEHEFLGAHPAHSDPLAAQDARVLTLPSAASPDPAVEQQHEEPAAEASTPVEDPAPTEPVVPEAEEPPRPRSRKGRASVPSWDEIVFGARRD